MSHRVQNEPGAQQSSDNESGLSGGFRSFWKKSDETASHRNVTFVQQDPTSKKKSNRITRLFRQASSPSASESAHSEESGKSTAQKRRQQVYQAQKRHRNRKAEYVKNLEDEVARLQHLDALINHEKTALAHQNEAIRAYLASQSIDIRLESMSLSTPSTGNDGLSALGGAALDIRFDPEVGHDRVFMDFEGIAGSEMTWTSGSSTLEGAQRSMKRRHVPVKGDSWAALDFILALEWPCKDHVHHPGIHPHPERLSVPDEFTGHALTTTAAVFQSALPPTDLIHDLRQQMAPDTRSAAAAAAASSSSSGAEKRWQLPHSEIDKLVMLSEKLELDDEQMTPAQAYSAIRETVSTDELLRPTLEAIKAPLGSLVHCTGVGAILPADMFWQQLDIALQTVRSERANLPEGFA